MISIDFFDCMCIKSLRKYFKKGKIGEGGKVQSKEMEKAIDQSKDISEAYLQGGKAIGEIVKPKKKK